MNLLSPQKHLAFAVLLSFWVPAMTAASYEWINGEYYSYGWFVPPAAIWLSWKRWHESEKPIHLPARKYLVLVILLVPWFTGLRILGYVDPSWRLPIGLLGLTAAICWHVWIGITRDWMESGRFGWITLLWLSAIPWPSVLETGVIRHLTEAVTQTVAEVFQLFGRPVEVLGDRLQLNELTVEVTDGCSGVRSFQSFIMASWLFSEIQRLRWYQGMLLLLIATGLGFLVNMGRTYALASVRFEQGQKAFDSAHDSFGLLAFIISGVLFYVISGKFSSNGKRKLRRTVRSIPENTV